MTTQRSWYPSISLPPFKWTLEQLLDGDIHVVDCEQDNWPGAKEALVAALYQAAKFRGVKARVSSKGLASRHALSVQAYNPHRKPSLEYWIAELRLVIACSCQSTSDVHQMYCNKVRERHTKDPQLLRAGLLAALDDILLPQPQVHTVEGWQPEVNANP
jgi:hypothetical protein